VDLPGPAGDSYTEEQKEFVEELNETWQRRLEVLQDRVSRGAPLSEAEKAAVLTLTTEAGANALEKAHQRVRTQRGLRERFRRGLEISRRYEDRFRAIFRDAGLPEDLAYLPHVESSYQAEARSSAGAVGVWQFTRGTGRHYLRIDSAVDERLDPVAAARAAAAYLENAHDALDSWPLALTSYNHGLVGMTRAAQKLGNDYERILREYDGRLFGFASKNFYAEFLAARAIARDPARHFPEGLNFEAPLDLDSLVLERRIAPRQIAAAFGIPTDELAAINPAWTRRALRSSLALPRGSTVWLPAGTLAGAGAVRLPDWSPSDQSDREGVYVVRRGDSLSLIATAHGMQLSRLRELNGIGPGESRILPGQRLRIGPDAPDRIHVVRKGESLSVIAAAYGMRLSALRAMNGLDPGDDRIVPGQRLRVEPAHHVVRRGDTLLGIALRHGVSLSALLALNQLSESSIIHPGQRIQIPAPS
jgi:membrane-bound lytic murein transglycosylase D